jgi:nucleoside-diphosphate-sugar epimerase
MTVAQIAEVIWKACGRDAADLRFEHLATFEVDVVRRWPSVDKAREVLGWEARITVEDGVAATVEWLRGVLEVPAG